MLFAVLALALDVAPDPEATSLPFEVALKPGISVRVSEGPDFDVYYFQRGEHTLGGAYVGFAPDFPKGSLPGRKRIVEGGIEQIVDCEGDRAVSRQLLIPRQGGVIHAWSLNGDAAERAEAEAILASIHPDGSGARPTPLLNCLAQ